MSSHISEKEKQYYTRQLMLETLNEEKQKKLKDAKVLVIGAGGLGCSAIIMLANSGIGTIGIVDGDKIEEHNLHRQILYTINDIGRQKVDIAKNKIEKQNPFTKIVVYNKMLNKNNALDIVKNYDIIIDATDNLESRYLVNDACYFAKKPYIYGAVRECEGCVSVFNAQDKNKKLSPNFRCVYPFITKKNETKRKGVMAPFPGIIGNAQALEAIKIIAKIGTPLIGKMWIINFLDNTTSILTIQKNPNNPLNGKKPSITRL